MRFDVGDQGVMPVASAIVRVPEDQLDKETSTATDQPHR